jgi:SPP1 gp7 family putative phage head morphogenesis protein
VRILSLEKKTKDLIKLTDGQERQMIKDLQRQYGVALKETRRNIADAYAKYSVNAELTFAEMQKYTRLSRLEESIVDELNILYSGTGKEIRQGVGKVYEQSYYFTGYILETEAQTKLAYTLLPKQQITRAIQNPISGLTLNERLANNRRLIILKTREQLVQGLIQGDSIRTMANRIKDVFEGDLNKSVRIVRTETNRARNLGTLDSYEHAKDKGLEFDTIWVASLDDRTRDTHADLDGQKADKDGFFHIDGLSTTGPSQFGIASEDINCRCSTRAEFKDLEPTERRVRGEGVIPYTTFREWEESRLF